MTTLSSLQDSLGYAVDGFHFVTEIHREYYAQTTVSSQREYVNSLVISLKSCIILNRHCISECYRLQHVVWFVISVAYFDVKVVKRHLA